jgi:shikimate 5-dehydrogenase
MAGLHVPVEPTFYFIGVTTARSTGLRMWPRWMEALGRSEVAIQGIDFVPHDEPARYRALVEQIKFDPLVVGGLVTTHKIDLLDAARDLFDSLDEYATICDEVSSIAKRDGKLVGAATDPVAGGASLDAILGPGYFARTGAHILCFGAGGSAAALSLHLIRQNSPGDRPSRIVIVNRSQPRLDRLRAMVDALDTEICFEYICNDNAAANDAIMAVLPDGSVVVNATGMGKDRPGSPVTDHGLFPHRGVAWELNYRGELNFLHQALAQRQQRGLTVEDGWDYFLRGWTSVIAHVLDLTINADTFHRLAAIAAEVRG